MKRYFALILAFVLCLSMCACGGGNGASEAPTEEVLRLATPEDSEEDIILTNAAYAVSYLSSILKNPHSIEVYSVKTKFAGGAYFYLINYSAENNFGGRVENTCCISLIQKKIGVPATYFLTMNFEDASDKAKEAYDTFIGAEESKLDVDKVMALYSLIAE